MSSDRFAWLPVHKLLFLVVYWSLAFLDGSKNYLVLHFINFSILKKMLLLWPTIHLQCSVAPSTGGHTETHTHTAICCWTNHELCRNIWHHLMVTSSCSSFWPTLTVFARLIATVLHEAERGLFFCDQTCRPCFKDGDWSFQQRPMIAFYSASSSNWQEA